MNIGSIQVTMVRNFTPAHKGTLHPIDELFIFDKQKDQAGAHIKSCSQFSIS